MSFQQILNILVPVLIVGGPAISWIFKKLAEQAALKKAQQARKAREMEALRTGRTADGQPLSRADQEGAPQASRVADRPQPRPAAQSPKVSRQEAAKQERQKRLEELTRRREAVLEELRRRAAQRSGQPGQAGGQSGGTATRVPTGQTPTQAGPSMPSPTVPPQRRRTQQGSPSRPNTGQGSGQGSGQVQPSRGQQTPTRRAPTPRSQQPVARGAADRGRATAERPEGVGAPIPLDSPIAQGMPKLDEPYAIRKRAGSHLFPGGHPTRHELRRAFVLSEIFAQPIASRDPLQQGPATSGK